MLVVGELINASRKKIGAAIKDQDADFIKKMAKDQHEAGADYIDANAGIFVGKEPEYLTWLVKNIQEVVDGPCAIDSPDPKAIEAALAVHKGTPMINSISLEKERFDALAPILAGTDMKVIALCMSDEGMPETTDARVAIADKLINGLVKNNVAIENIYVDALVQPVSTNNTFGIGFLDAVEQIKKQFAGVNTICGLSNISYGLPNRFFLNQAFMVMAIAKGLDGAIIDPLDKRMMANIVASEAIIGRDDYCMKYLQAFRDKKFEF